MLTLLERGIEEQFAPVKWVHWSNGLGDSLNDEPK